MTEAGFDRGAVLRIPREVASYRLGERLFLVHAEDHCVLNPTAARFWEAFDRLVESGRCMKIGEFPPSRLFFDPATFPEDMRYHNPVIQVYSLSSELRTNGDGGVL